MKLYRAANDDYVDTGYSFSQSKQAAKQYLDNGAFGGTILYQARIHPLESQILDLRGLSVSEAANILGMKNPGAVGVDQWVTSTTKAQQKAREMGFLWVKVDESFPTDSTTWIWIGSSRDSSPELFEVDL